MLRVLHLITTMPVGGAESLILTTIRELDSQAFTSVICCIQDKGPLGEETERQGIPVVALGRMQRKGFDRRVVGDLVSRIRRERIDVIHCHLHHAALYGRLAARRARIPSVVTVHNVYAKPKWHRRLLNRWLAKSTARVVAVSAAVGEDVLRYDRIDPERLMVIPNGIDLARAQSALTKEEARQRLGLPPDAQVIGCVGRLEAQKGHRFLLEALAALRTCPRGLAHPAGNPYPLIVGDGGELGALRQSVAELGLDDRVRLLGTRRDIADILRALDLFVLPSLWEGLPLALLEAMAAGVPVIASQVGGVGEVLEGGECGVALPAGDIAALSAAIGDLLSDTERRCALGQRGAERVKQRYSAQAMVARLADIYATSVNDNDRPERRENHHDVSPMRL